MLWHEKLSIPVIGLTGEYESGKTLFGLTIDPEHTICFDFELSAAPYKDSLGFAHVDMADFMLKSKPDGFKPVDTFEAWLEQIKAIEPGKFKVIMVDTIGDIETGLADYVASKHRDYGFSSPDKFQSTGGIFWSHVKAFWKQVLTDLAARCETFVFTSHLKAVWVGGRATKQKEPMGKSTMMELASLYLELSRKVNKGGKIVTTELPNAVVRKSRLVRLVDGVLKPCLPAAFSKATPGRVREYIENPPNLAKPKADEKAEAAHLTEDERLQLQAEVAANEATAAEAKLERARMTQAAYAKQPQSKPQARETVAKPDTDRGEEPAKVNDTPTQAEKQEQDGTISADHTGQESASSEQLKQLKQLKDVLGLGNEKWKKVLDFYKVTTAKNLCADDCDQLIDKLAAKARQKQGKGELDEWADGALTAKN